MRLKWCKISMRAKDWCFLSQPKKCSIILSIQRGQIHGVNFVTLLSYVSTQLNKVAGMFTYLISINISSLVEFQRWWVLKSKIFAQESTCSKEKKFCRWMTVHRKVPILYFESRFFMSKIVEIKKKKKSFKNINLGGHFFLKNIIF